MKLFYQICCLGIIIALSAPHAASQGTMRRGGRGGGRGMGPGMMNQGSVPGVQLTADQQQRIAAIRQETMERVRSIMRDPNLSPSEKQTQANAARQAGHQKVMDVLTPEQQQQFLSCWATGTCMGQRGGQGMGPGMMNQGSVPGVQLSADQQQRIAAIRQETRNKVASIMSNSNLSAAEKQSQAEAARQAGHEKVLGVLTPEQRQQFDQNWSSMGPGMMGPGMGGMMPGGQMPMGTQPSNADDASPPPGKAIFDQNCVRCHGADGKTVAGWRTTVSKMSITDIQTRIKNGIDGMPAFKSTLTEEQIEEVASYAKSLASGTK